LTERIQKQPANTNNFKHTACCNCYSKYAFVAPYLLASHWFVRVEKQKSSCLKMSGFFNLGSKSQAAASKTATANSNNNTKNNTLSKTIFDGIQQTLLKGIPTKLNNLTKTIVGVTNKKRASLVAGYTPGDMDVCCGRGKRNWNHKVRAL
jgi:hypothetical protein